MSRGTDSFSSRLSFPRCLLVNSLGRQSSCLPPGQRADLFAVQLAADKVSLSGEGGRVCSQTGSLRCAIASVPAAAARAPSPGSPGADTAGEACYAKHRSPPSATQDHPGNCGGLMRQLVSRENLRPFELLNSPPDPRACLRTLELPSCHWCYFTCIQVGSSSVDFLK